MFMSLSRALTNGHLRNIHTETYVTFVVFVMDSPDTASKMKLDMIQLALSGYRSHSDFAVRIYCFFSFPVMFLDHCESHWTR